MIEHQEQIHLADGTADALLVRPEGDEVHPGIIVFTDIFGLRGDVADQARRIAGDGYVVLVPNIFYRTSKPPVFDFAPDFGNERTKQRFAELTGPLTPEAMASDAAVDVDALAAHPFVSPGPMGVVGFCFSGQFALRAAAARPARIAAAASFHGGGLATGTDHSPHLVLARHGAPLFRPRHQRPVHAA